jgi:hypothetical protein
MLLHPPVIVGLTICRDVQIDPASLDISLLHSFTGLAVDSFPGSGRPFCVVAVLTDGAGSGELELIVTKLDDPMEVARRIRLPLRFRDRLQLVQCVIRVNHCDFPSSGLYLFSLYADGEWLAQKAIRVYLMGTGP